MKVKLKWAILITALALTTTVVNRAQDSRNAAPPAPSPNNVLVVTRFYTGADRRSHADQSEAKFGADDTLKLPVTGAELHWMPQGTSRAPQQAARRMYEVTLSGNGEISLTDGKKYSAGPGTVDVVEDTMGLGHLTNNIENRLTIWLSLAEFSQAAKGSESRTAAAAAVPSAGSEFKPVTITRVFAGPDGLSHAEVLQPPFASDGTMKLNTSGGELHWQLHSASAEPHDAPRRQYVITLRGTGELEIAGGQKIPISPGNIDLMEDTTGKGHITHNFTDRLTLWLPLAD